MTNKPETIPAVKDDLFIYNGRKINDLTVNLVIDFKGLLDEEVLRKAIILSIQSELILNYKFDAKGIGRPKWRLDKNIDYDSLFTIINVESDEQRLEQTEFFFSKPLDPASDNVLKICLIRDQNDSLIFKLSHVVADGGGMVEYIARLANTYTTLLSDPAYIPPPIEGDRSLKQIYKNFSFIEKLKVIPYSFRVIASRFRPRGNWSLPLKPGGKDQPRFLRYKLDELSCNYLNKFCKTNKFTIHEVLTALYFRALHKTIKPKPNTPMRLLSTTNLRRYTKKGVGEAPCNLSSVLIINIGKDLGINLADTTQKVHDAVEWQKDSYMGLNSHRTSPLNIKFLPYFLVSGINMIASVFSFLVIDSATLPPLFTNIGRVTKNVLRFGTQEIIDFYGFAPIPTYPMSYTGAIGFGDEISLTVAFYNEVIDEEVMQTLFSDMEKDLKNDGSIAI
ncbi:hypothetical protein NBRC116493_24600 [Aurantivibrio infirmus]